MRGMRDVRDEGCEGRGTGDERDDGRRDEGWGMRGTREEEMRDERDGGMRGM